MKALLKIFGTCFILLPIFLFGQDCVTFNNLTVGNQYGTGTHTAGQNIFGESGIAVSVENFVWTGGGGTFNYCRVDAPFAWFGQGPIMQTNNINLKFDFTGLGYVPNVVAFEFADLGGNENISVNGNTITADELTNAAGVVASGVTLSVTTYNVTGGKRGIAVLVGPVQTLLIGGQEFWLDNICAYRPNLNTNMKCVTFDPLTIGAQFGNPAGNSQKEVIFVEDDIPVAVDEFFWTNGGSTFNYSEVQFQTPNFGIINTMWTNNINLRFDLTHLGFIANKVTFEYADYGGNENISVNGEAISKGELSAAPMNIASGVTLQVISVPISGGVKGLGILTGQIDSLLLGGQEFLLDNICAFDTSVTGIRDNTPDLKNIETFYLGQNYPNPFNPVTTISFKVKEQTEVTLIVYNMLGKEVAVLTDKEYLPGRYDLNFDASRLASGIYFYKLTAGRFTDVKKMILLQ